MLYVYTPLSYLLALQRKLKRLGHLSERRSSFPVADASSLYNIVQYDGARAIITIGYNDCNMMVDMQ